MSGAATGEGGRERHLLLTNDDGIDSLGLHVLARAMRPLGRVTIVAPDTEYSGAGASIGALHQHEPEIKRAEVEGIDDAWTVSGPPGLCVFYARMGAFGFTPDMIVSGINPGANLGRAVYHSGTIGAVLTGRNGNIPGVAVSQSFAALDPEDEDNPDGTIDGPTDGSDGDDLDADADNTSTGSISAERYAEMISHQIWDSAADIAAEVVAGMIDTRLEDVGVLNLNVPNLPIDQIKGWRWTEVGRTPPWAMREAKLVPHQPGRDGSENGRDAVYRVETSWALTGEQPPDSDSAAILDEHVSVTWLSRIEAVRQAAPAIDVKLDGMLG